MSLKDFKTIENFSQSDGVVKMRISNKIVSAESGDYGVTGEEFSRAFDYAENVLGAKRIEIYINSSGGSLFDGLEIYSTIKDSKVPTETIVVGVSASIAGIISQAGKIRKIKDYGIFHAHSPRPKEGASVSSELLSKTFDSLKTIIMSSTKLDEDKVVSILSQETFLKADEALELGFFDEVITSDLRSVDIDNCNSASQIMAVFNDLDLKKVNKNSMKKVNAILGLQDDASESSAVSAITSLKAGSDSASDLEAKVAVKDARILELESQVEANTKQKAIDLVENAIKDGKIDEKDESLKSLWIENATKDFDNASKMIESIKSVTASVKVETSTQADAVKAESRKDWDFGKWSQEDSKGLEKMRVNNKAEFDKLLNAYTEA